MFLIQTQPVAHENFRLAFHWVRTLDSAIHSAKLILNNLVLVQFTLPAADNLMP